MIFQIQPLASKVLLPLFGGGAGVWTTCLFFFQLFLLVGYFYAHTLSKLKNIKAQVLIHVCLVLCSYWVLPFELAHSEFSFTNPSIDIVWLLTVSIGLPFAILSATSPLMQSWFTFSRQTGNPYQLYAISNFGSFLALILYPVLVEPFVTLELQSILWTIGYVVFSILIGYIGFKLSKLETGVVSEKIGREPTVNTSIKHFVIWFLLSALGVVLLVSVTNAMSQNIPPVPFLWLSPLAIYLVTYIVCFGNIRFYKPNVWLVIYGITAFIALFIYFIGGQFDIATQVTLYLLILFSATMVCHGELSKLKPKTEHATFFYLVISLGGVFGSFMVSFISPLIFDEFTEYPIAIFSVFILFSFSALLKTSAKQDSSIKNTLIWFNNRTVMASISGVVGVLWLLMFYSMNLLYQQFDLDKSRNFYGILSVKDIVQGDVEERRLVDGSTAHGAQSLNEDVTLPLSYYRPNTGVELVLSELSKDENIDVGIIGLGVGALGAYGNEGDNYHFYELNPAVIEFANRHFRFLKQSKANISVRLGDARISLQKEFDKGITHQFDVLVVDAFSGDVIPTHLLTREAFKLYHQQITSQGTIILHISNRHLDLLPVVLGNAKYLGMQALLFSTQGGKQEHDTDWVILTNKTSILTKMDFQKTRINLADNQLYTVDWTDDYSSILPILKIFN
ncbi:fused MFS/spermidine synthase [Paraglaciecola sp.]|uniref:fused MFS/spermidine synthase n=1 Tax=Paraglaciecola sp. TaxID=1920173 RepID=UPI003EF2D018